MPSSTKNGAWVITIVWLLAGGIAQAKPPVTVAVLGIEATAGAPADVASQLTIALKNRVMRVPGFQQVQGKNLDEVKLVFGCVDEKPACMARVGRSLQASKLLWGALRPAGTEYSLTLRYLDVHGERLEHTVTERISQDEATRPSDAVARVTAAFLVSGGTIKLGCNVIGARVLLGAAVKGLTDDSTMLVQDVPTGTHLLRVSKRGYQTWRRRVTITAGQTLEIEAEMRALTTGSGAITAPPPDDREPTFDRRDDDRRGWQIAFWSGAAITVGLGAGMLATGIGVLNLQRDKKAAIVAISGDDWAKLTTQVQDDLQYNNACAVSRDGITGGVAKICDDGTTRATIFNALLVAGILASTVTTYLLYKAYIADPDEQDEGDDLARRPPQPRWNVTTAAGPQGAQVGFSLRF